ncbi:MAG: hypothetical protein M1832_004203 [Thelocarpon impressellum]|nr:MAG: hypothetical protein M1832_004203 [Thelocarpon impressellum]
MATFHSQEPLLLDVIPPDEDMELSSDVDHRPDGEDIDVDVDVDLTSDRPPDGDDDYLIEDAHPEVVEDLLAVPEGINDDVMHDEDRTSLVMEDDTLVPDEELVDVENIGQGLIGTSTDDLGTADADAIALPRTPPFADDETQLKAAVASPEKAHSLQAPENPIDDVSDKTPAAGAVSTLDPSSEQDGRDYSVLPVVIGYEGSQVSLFPPSKDDSSETFFLKDEGLANSTISKLFGALRSVLAESIDEDDELEFGLDIFGLSIREDSLHARISTLAEILELHARLLRNDGVEYPDAFYMTLTAKPGLPRRLRDIAEAVAEGKGLSYVATWDDEETGQEAEEASESPHRPNTDTSNTRDDHGHGTAPGVMSHYPHPQAESTRKLALKNRGTRRLDQSGKALPGRPITPRIVVVERLRTQTQVRMETSLITKNPEMKGTVTSSQRKKARMGRPRSRLTKTQSEMNLSKPAAPTLEEKQTLARLIVILRLTRKRARPSQRRRMKASMNPLGKSVLRNPIKPALGQVIPQDSPAMEKPKRLINPWTSIKTMQLMPGGRIDTSIRRWKGMKYIGLALAIMSTMAIGTSFVITKRGLIEASERHGFEGEGHAYLRSPTWWGGIITLVVGEVANFAAYAFAPAILVTPLGALSVLIGAVLGAYFLKEELGTLGKLGCAMCLIGSVIIVLHAPPDKEIQTVDEILQYAIRFPFLLYCTIVGVFAIVMIYRIAPQYGRSNPLIYLSICSTVGSVSVMSVKAFGIALKLTLAGNNQFSHPSTYVFAIVTIMCILTQMNYFNKALSQFSTSIVNPLYYVTFTTATLCASFILFSGFNTTDAVNTLSLLSGFLVIFAGVYLLNLSRGDPDGHKLLNGHISEGIPTDGIAGIQTRRSMQARRSSIEAGRLSSGSLSYGRGDREGLIHAYDEENGDFGLTDLAEESEGDDKGDAFERAPVSPRHAKTPNR